MNDTVYFESIPIRDIVLAIIPIENFPQTTFGFTLSKSQAEQH